MRSKTKTPPSNSRASMPKRFLALPELLFRPSPDFANRAPLDVMSKAAQRTLFFLLGQYSGWNNGDLAIAPKVCKGYDIPRSTARKGAAELAYMGLIVETRRGGLNMPSLYGVTWLGLDNEVSSKFNEGIEASHAPLQSWTLQYRNTRTRHLVEEHEKTLSTRKGRRTMGRDESATAPLGIPPTSSYRKGRRAVGMAK